MKNYTNPTALLVKLTANDVLNGSWNAEDTDELAGSDMRIDISGLGW